MMARLKELYDKEIAPALLQELGYKNPMQAPRLEKVVINMGVGEALADKNALEHALNDLQLISGQKPALTRARKSVAGFKLRAGWAVGCKVTLRRQRMYEFFDRLVNVAIPRVRDFRGISPRSMDRAGNCSIGIAEQIIFPEIDYDKTDKLRGMDISIVIRALKKEDAYALLRAFKFPFRETH